MPPIPHVVKKSEFQGSSAEEIANEPDWTASTHHHIGFFNEDERVPGLTHDGDEEFEELAEEKEEELKERYEEGDLLNFRDIMNGEEDFHLREPEKHSQGWRFVLNTREDWVKNEQKWPANIKRKQKEEQAKKKEEQEKDDKDQDKQDGEKAQSEDSSDKKGDKDQQKDGKKGDGDEKLQQEHEMQPKGSKHHDAYAAGKTDQDDADSKDKSEDEKSKDKELEDKYSPQELALLRSLEHESKHMYGLKQNFGKVESPVAHHKPLLTVDEADQFTPDNWIPRSDKLVRLTGKHPLNAEPDLSALFAQGLVTPNEFHYVRNHGAVPFLRWETHELEIKGMNGESMVLTMDNIREKFDSYNIQVALACDGNRRKELNMLKKSKGFSWGAGAISCAFWKGPLLRDVLLSAEIPFDLPQKNTHRYWVNFEGGDEPSEGKYATSIPFDYAMDSTSDVILAYEMNDVVLPPDHGYPLRLIIPGYVGGRCVKWLSKIWISDHENQSHYHIWDNRVLPTFVSEKDGPFAEAMFHHPSTACNEQNLNSVIVKPAQGEMINLAKLEKDGSYRIEGYAYDGGGHEVQRVEISLDGGATWLYCIRNFPEYPVRHGSKFWTWLHWHIDVKLTHIIRASEIIVRCFNVFKNTQPEHPVWNIMGMMNNCYYRVKPTIKYGEDNLPNLTFQHPVLPGTGEGGWMKQSTENQLNTAKQTSNTPEKQFTRAEIEKHNSENDCWIVVDGKVYDATSVLAWHPGGKAAIVGHGGKVHSETSEEFASIHDDYAYKKLNECIIGELTEKAAKYVKASAEAAAKQKAADAQSKDQKVALQKHRWVKISLKDRKKISDDTNSYIFQLPKDQPKLGLGTCQHIQLGYHLKDKMVIRSYTPTMPIVSSDENGTFELVVKTYYPSSDQPGGAMSNILDTMSIGGEIDLKGPTGDITYEGQGKFKIGDSEKTFSKVTLILGGSGITPGYQLICKILRDSKDKTELRVLDANKSEKDILLREELDKMAEEHKEQFQIHHVLSHPSDEWKGRKGHLDEDMVKECGFAPGENSGVFLCGPPAMIQKAALPALKDWGYKEDQNCFGF